MKAEAIKEIKLKLATLTDAHDPYLTILAEDKRSGVQKLLQQFYRRLEKEQALKDQYFEMTRFERELYQKGHRFVAGIDEVGRGPLAGPVVAAAVVLPANIEILGLNDSKQLSAKKRAELYAEIQAQAVSVGIGVVDHEEIDRINILQASKKAMLLALESAKKRAELYAEIQAQAVSVGIGVVDHEEIDRINILQASKKAMLLALEDLTIKPSHLLVDAVKLDCDLPQDNLIKGDARSVSIAAASIIAKEMRDNLMKEYHQIFPFYAFDKNAGYGTKDHLNGLAQHGISPIHRKSFAPVKKYL